MSGAIAAWSAVAVLAASAYQADRNASKSRKQQAAAQDQALRQAEKQEQAADRAFNAQNKKRPNTANIFAANSRDALPGTMLTGPMGAAPDASLLGRSTLLGS